MTKTIDTLVEDIYNVFLEPDHKINPKNLEELGENMKRVVQTAITEAGARREPTLRMSVIGKPDRQLWYELNKPDTTKVVYTEKENIFEPNPQKYIMFLYGHIMEQLLIFLILEAGHTLSHDQEELEIDGVMGHCDPVIDGTVVDIKTASNYSFSSKFKAGKLLRGDDPFGYVGQISGYKEKLMELYPDEIDPDRAGWLALNKETGELCLLIADNLDLINAEDRIRHIKSFLEKGLPPPEKCYPTKPEGTSGNQVLSSGCHYCPFRDECYKDVNGGVGLRKFQYSNGPKYFTQVVKTPKVDEIFE